MKKFYIGFEQSELTIRMDDDFEAVYDAEDIYKVLVAEKCRRAQLCAEHSDKESTDSGRKI